MTKYIAVTPYLLGIPQLKRAALLFDTIGLLGLDDFLVRPYLDEAVRADLAWMASEGILIPVSSPPEDSVEDETVKLWIKERKRRLRIRANETFRFGTIEREYDSAIEELREELRKKEEELLSKESVSAEELASFQGGLRQMS